MSKKLLLLVIISALVGGVLGSVFSAKPVRANFLDDFLGFFGGKIGSNASGTPVVDGKPKADVPLYKPAIDYEQAVVGAVDSASPSVVSIVVTKDLPVIENCPSDPFAGMPPEFRQFFGGSDFTQPCQKGTKSQEVGGGSGFIISEDGLIVTNKHVVYDTKADYTVLTNDGKKYDAKVLARDPVNDLAVIKITASGLRAATLGDSDSVKLGQTAIAIGNSLGEFRNTVSAGVISGLARTVTASGAGFGDETIKGVIQTDAAINPGNSGGPLLDLKGEVIGINTAVASGAQNIGFAIPINQAKRAIESVKKTGEIKTPYIGVRYTIVTEDMAKQQKLPANYGALLRGADDGPAVIKDSPAAKAGLQAEDIILEVNGKKIDESNALSNLIQGYGIGDTIKLKVQRGDKVMDIDVVLGERPKTSQ
jgi:serine protease Do